MKELTEEYKYGLHYLKNGEKTIAVFGTLNQKFFIQYYGDSDKIEFEFYCNNYRESKEMVEKMYGLLH